MGFISPNFLHFCVIITAEFLLFELSISKGVSIGKCLTSIQIRLVVILFEFYCEYSTIRRDINSDFCDSPFFCTLRYK